TAATTRSSTCTRSSGYRSSPSPALELTTSARGRSSAIHRTYRSIPSRSIAPSSRSGSTGAAMYPSTSSGRTDPITLSPLHGAGGETGRQVALHRNAEDRGREQHEHAGRRHPVPVHRALGDEPGDHDRQRARSPSGQDHRVDEVVPRVQEREDGGGRDPRRHDRDHDAPEGGEPPTAVHLGRF